MQYCPGHAATGIGKVAQRGARCIGPASMGQLHPQRRHACDCGDTLARAGLYHVLWAEIIDKDSGGAACPGRRKLAQACIKAKRKDGQDSIGARMVQIMSDAPRTFEQVAVAEHDALGSPRRAGCIENGREVRVNARCRDIGCFWLRVDSVPGEALTPTTDPCSPVVCRCRFIGGICEDRMGEGERPVLGQQACTHCAGNQADRATVVQDMCDLLRFEQRIDRHKNAARGGNTEQRHDGFDALVQKDADTCARRDAERGDRVAKCTCALDKFLVAQADIAEYDRVRIGCLMCSCLHEVKYVSHGVEWSRRVEEDARWSSMTNHQGAEAAGQTAGKKQRPFTGLLVATGLEIDERIRTECVADRAEIRGE
ncbi:hypothetical protein BURCENBC7_AP4032 [Burkholderia cenocepacia BC7]|nr:hypothetical protein BURCENK562V_C5364 [Burkholderia cenocepacia K56-2Valvano]ERI29577.1 hypothetical protein BURCENBC7_AP4032 [Burkholderia cenocepacia BC7]